MHFKDMKWYMKALMGLLVLLLFPVLLLLIIATLAITILFPLFEIPYYKRSVYHRAFGEKYSFFITRTPRYQIFRRLRRYRPDVAFPPAGNDRFHCFTVGDTLVLFGMFDRFVFDSDTGEWCAAMSESDEPRPLAEAIAEYPFLPDGTKYPTTGVKILASTSLFYEENIHCAYADPRFVICKSKKDLKKKLLSL
ncbi:MAG: hypothetical protein IJY43_06940 [Clostridia bacterium]|nr:hypothetical protein [Clostridia bacterium]